jgi:hypothetical protein
MLLAQRLIFGPGLVGEVTLRVVQHVLTFNCLPSEMSDSSFIIIGGQAVFFSSSFILPARIGAQEDRPLHRQRHVLGEGLARAPGEPERMRVGRWQSRNSLRKRGTSLSVGASVYMLSTAKRMPAGSALNPL